MRLSTESGRPRGLRWRILVTVACGLAGAGLALAYALCRMPRIYEATATVVFPLAGESRMPTIAGIDMPSVVPTGSSIPLTAYEAVITSDRSYQAAGLKAGMTDIYRIESERDIVPRLRSMVAVRFRSDRIMVLTTRVPGTPRLSLRRQSARGPDGLADGVYRQFAQDLVYALIDQMGVISDSISLDRAKTRQTALRRRVQTEEAKAARLESQLAALQTELGNLELTSYVQRLTNEYVSAQRVVSDLGVQLAALHKSREMRRRYVDQQLNRVTSLPGDLPLLRERREAVMRARSEYDRLALMYGPDNSGVRQAKQRLQTAQRLLDEGTRSVRMGLEPTLIEVESSINELTAKRQEAERVVSNYQTRLRQMPGSSLGLAQLMHEATTQRAQVDRLRNELLGAELEYERSGVRWYILDQPRLPRIRISPKPKQIGAIGLLAGLALGGWPLLLSAVQTMLRVDGDA